ncbi:MAG: hypothetical protein K2W85_11780 [Phycisphaerales bacterium]|nr:hypothetical protein [Phycisphaerales bacterium]
MAMASLAQHSPARDDASTGALWAKAQRAGGEVGPLLRAVMANCTLVSLQGGGDGPRRALVSIAPSWAHRAAKWTEQIGELLGKHVGGKVIVEWAGGVATGEGSGGDEPGNGSSAGESGSRALSGDGGASRGAEPVQVTDHPLVQRAIELFGGRVVDVQPRRK